MIEIKHMIASVIKRYENVFQEMYYHLEMLLPQELIKTLILFMDLEILRFPKSSFNATT